MFENTETETYFTINSIGILESGVEKFIGKRVKAEMLDVYASRKEIVHHKSGPKIVKLRKTEIRKAGIKCFDISDFLEI